MAISLSRFMVDFFLSRGLKIRKAKAGLPDFYNILKLITFLTPKRWLRMKLILLNQLVFSRP